MKSLFAIFYALTLFPYSAATVAEEFRELEDFLTGKYELIGKAPASESTYFGRVKIFRAGDALKVDRIINGKHTKGTAAVEKITADNIKILRIRFVENGKKYEETCLIGSDLDNYARITCHLYEPAKTTNKPGLEALFISTGEE